MSTPARYRLACDPCEAISHPAEVLELDSPHTADDFLAAHHRCGPGTHLRLLHHALAGHERPFIDWTPRPLYGPPVPGGAQDVVCPNCQAMGGAGPRDQVTWKATTAGETLVFCRACGYTWGPGAEADWQRSRLRRQGTRTSVTRTIGGPA